MSGDLNVSNACYEKQQFFAKRQACKADTVISGQVNSPYIGNNSVTQDDIQMRRKAEILQYRGPGRPGLNNASTSRVISGPRAFQYINYVNACTTPLIERETESYRSAIPGQMILITYKPSVVLYNYRQTTGLITPEITNSPELEACYAKLS
jgi:hypothetical protein